MHFVVGFGRVNVNRTKLFSVALMIFAVTVWLYWPCVHGGFLSRMDDDEDLRQSARFNGQMWNSIKYAFTTTHPYYNPLSRLSSYLDYKIWGKNPVGHHATGVVVHALNASLVFGLLWTLLGAASLTTGERLAIALGVAVTFAIHPFQAESVAWLSCRTHLLGTTFMVGCLWAYVAHRRRWETCALFAAALLCKPTAVSLPLVMLAVDYYPLRRYEQLHWARLVWEKAGLVMLGVLASAATIVTETRTTGMMISLKKVPLSQRTLLMFQSLAFYPWRLVHPTHLSPFYPLQLGLSLDQWRVLVPVLSVVIITGLAVWAWRQLPALAAGWAAYVVLILPVSGLLQSGMQSVALRYAYLAMLPLLLLVGGAAVWVWRRGVTVARSMLVGLLVCELCAFGFLTHRLIPVWHDDKTLWGTTLTQFPDSIVANNLMVLTLLDQHRTDDALQYAQRYVEIQPQLCLSHYNLGLVLSASERPADAVGEFEQALRLKPDYADAHKGLGLALERTGKLPEAVSQYMQALQLKPDDAQAHNDLGLALKKMGKVPEAARQYDEALRINPEYIDAENNLAWLLATLAPTEGGDPARAVALAQRTCKLSDGRVATYLDTLAAAYAAAGRFNDAITTAEKAVDVARAGGQTQLVGPIKVRLALYGSGRAYRQPIGEVESHNP